MSVPTGVSIPRIRRGENRFYSPPAIRRRLQQEQQLQKTSLVNEVSVKVKEVEKRTESNECGPCSNLGVTDLANLDRFSEHTTPAVPAQFFPKIYLNRFKEWSAYGAGVPLVLNDGDSVVQYYVPYLSAIQLYVEPSQYSSGLRKYGRVGDVEASKETSSDSSSEYGAKMQVNNVIHTYPNQPNAVEGFKRVTSSNRPSTDSSSDDNETRNSPGQLLFGYMEYDTPFSREPLSDKMSALGTSFLELWSFRSCDLSTSSWISVAWYTIYRIPTGPTLKNLDACFLTFHSLSTPLQGTSMGGVLLPWSRARDEHAAIGLPFKLSLPTFGLASYKFKLSFWNSEGDNDHQKTNSLFQAAEKWLRFLAVNHPDYNFFVSQDTLAREVYEQAAKGGRCSHSSVGWSSILNGALVIIEGRVKGGWVSC